MTTQRTPRFGRTRGPAVCLVALLAMDTGASPDKAAVEEFARTWRGQYGDTVDSIVATVMQSPRTVVAGEFVAVFDPEVGKHPLDNHRVTATFRVDEVFDGEEALAGARVIEVALWSDTLAYPGEEVSRREKRERLLAPYYEKRWAIEAQIKALDVTEGLAPEARARARRALLAQRDAVPYPVPYSEKHSDRDWVDGGIRLGTPYVVDAELRPFSKYDPEDSYGKWLYGWLYGGLKAAAMIPRLRTFWSRQSGGYFPRGDRALVDFAASGGREFPVVRFLLHPRRGYLGDTDEERPQDFRTQTVRLRESGYPEPFDGAFGEAPEAMFERLHTQASDLYDAAASAASGAARFVPWRRFEVDGRELAVNVKEVPPPGENDLPHRSSFASRIDYPGLWEWRVKHYYAVADAKLVSLGERRFLVVYWIQCQRYCRSELRSVELTTGP